MAFRRRRPFRRLPPMVRGRPIRRAALRQLRIAHQLLEEGRWSQAAEHFEQLASTAEQRGLPQTPNLFLLAGRARIENQEHADGLAHIHHAVESFDALGQIHRLSQIRARIIFELKRHGLEREAIELDAKIHHLLDLHHQAGKHITPEMKNKQLPTKCRSCGGSLRPDEMEWFDDQTAACAYCGSVVRAE